MFGRLHVDARRKLDRMQLRKEVLLDYGLPRYMRIRLSAKTNAGSIRVCMLGSRADS